LNLTKHLVEKVMLQNITTTTTTTTATTVWDQQQQRFYATQRPIQKKAQCTELFTASLVAAGEEWGIYVEAADLVFIKCKLPNELGARTTIHNVIPCLFCTTILPFPQRSSSKQHTYILWSDMKSVGYLSCEHYFVLGFRLLFWVVMVAMTAWRTLMSLDRKLCLFVCYETGWQQTMGGQGRCRLDSHGYGESCFVRIVQ
jgi:hypothetical protein